MVFLLITACTTTDMPLADNVLFQDKNQRADEILKLNDWTIKGKIAFISPDEKQSANIYWQQKDADITLKLTTFLGVSVLSLTSSNSIYTLKSDGKTWHDDNIENLLRQVSGIQLPVQALSFWIKGLKASNDDVINYSSTTDLPEQLQAYVNDKYWHIDYKKYQLIDNYRLAKSLTIKQNKLTIKLLINTWDLH
ncbi:lipoprotein insertase outer membrane protein LolB [Colwelliaceae bacterium BS250]